IDNISIVCPLPIDYQDYLKEYLKLNYWIPIIPAIGEEKTDRFLCSLPSNEKHMFKVVSLSLSAFSTKRLVFLRNQGFLVRVEGDATFPIFSNLILSGVSLVCTKNAIKTITRTFLQLKENYHENKKKDSANYEIYT